MNDSLLGAVWAWLTDPANWSGSAGIPVRLWEHVWISGVSVLIAALVGLPVALVLGHLGRGGALASAVANLGRAVPTLAVLVILVLSPEPFGITNVVTCTVAALVLFAIPPILTNAYAGMRGVDADLVEAARGMGLTGRQVLFRVELPLAVPLVVAGLRIATAQVIATATIAAIIAGPGLGRFITAGFGNQDTAQLIGGAVLVALFAVAVELAFQLLQRRLTPARSSRAVGEAEVDEAEAADRPGTTDRQRVPTG
ncbi:ABC transporter permease [Aquipuribacter nitratireducens]|uniref:ABC transporter permease n=1 Tax=Aquipuribacter nitratireducens TaxID=650104 RepID=A0ABW0GRG0_9MICO